MMPSVIHLDTSRMWRGGQLQVFLLHRELIRMGVASRVLARAGGDLSLRCEEAGLPVEAIRGLRPWYPPAVAAVVRQTRGATIVHAHDSHAIALAAVARAANPHLAVVGHRRIAYPVNGVSGRWKYRCVDRWIAVSTEIAGLLRRAGANDVLVVPSAVDVEELNAGAFTGSELELRSELGIDVAAPVVGLVGALVPHKGHRTLVTAAPGILAAVPDTVFLCVGEGRLRARLQRQARRIGVGAAFRFPGFRRDVPSLIRLCNVIAVPSLHGEGSNAVIKEAMAVGTPVVASSLPGNLELLGSFGNVVPAADARALGDAVKALLQDAGRVREIIAREPARSERWRPRAMAAATLAAYDDFGLRAETIVEAV